MSTDLKESVFNHPATIVERALSVDELKTIATKKRALDPSVFESNPPFFWRAEISNNRLDTYFTRMHASSLKNYAAEAEAGVSFQNAHLTRQLSFGRSLTGSFTGAQGNGIAKVLADFYTIPGLRLLDVGTDDFILGVKSGIISDVSIGFYGGMFRCNICGLDLFDWDCRHIPGVEYTPLDNQGNEREPVLAIAWVEEAHLSEVSAVYDGATPGAAILKAQQEAEGGRINPTAARFIEQRYRIKLPNNPTFRRFAGISEEESDMSGNKTENANNNPTNQPPAEPSARMPEAAGAGSVLEQEVTAMRATLGEVVSLDKVGTAEAVRQVVNELKEARQQLSTPDEQRTLAEMGRKYRADLIEEAHKEGVRAHGNDYAKDTYQAILERAEIDTIKRMRDDFKRVGDAKLPGGRQTVETDERQPEQPAKPEKRERRIPDRAYAA